MSINAYDAGKAAAIDLITELCNLTGEVSPMAFMESLLGDCISLAATQQAASAARFLEGFCSIIAPMLAEHCDQAGPEQGSI